MVDIDMPLTLVQYASQARLRCVPVDSPLLWCTSCSRLPALRAGKCCECSEGLLTHSSASMHVGAHTHVQMHREAGGAAEVSEATSAARVSRRLRAPAQRRLGSGEAGGCAGFRIGRP